MRNNSNLSYGTGYNCHGFGVCLTKQNSIEDCIVFIAVCVAPNVVVETKRLLMK